jgi:nucleotide-binding universal stress UspA family protein
MTTYSTLICPVDVASVDAAVVSAAFALAAPGATVHLVSVQEQGYVLSPLDGTPILPSMPAPEVLAETERKARARLEALIPTGPDAHGARAVCHVLMENGVASAICRFAEQQHADVIVVGTHARKGLDRLLMGSVATDVLHHANTSVVVVRAARSSKPRGAKV